MNFDTIFPDNRESGDTPLRQSQLVMLRMLKIFDYLCTRHEIGYFLIGGTLLGAIRHKGFIPWDDDLDIGMTRKDYEKFIAVAAAELPNDIYFQNTQTDKHYPHVMNVDARLRDKYSSYRRKNGKSNPWHEGLQVDIFVHDRAFPPNNYGCALLNLAINKLNSDSKRAAILKAIGKWSPFPLVYASNFMKTISRAKQCTYITEKECATLIRWQFEDMEAMIPQDYHSYLTRQYGDYMQLPPADKRVSNHKVIPDPFTPCGHAETLLWAKRAGQPVSVTANIKTAV